jgi:hypothetical protein
MHCPTSTDPSRPITPSEQVCTAVRVLELAISDPSRGTAAFDIVSQDLREAAQKSLIRHLGETFVVKYDDAFDALDQAEQREQCRAENLAPQGINVEEYKERVQALGVRLAPNGSGYAMDPMEQCRIDNIAARLSADAHKATLADDEALAAAKAGVGHE